MDKLIKIENLMPLVKKLRSQNKKIVMTNGCFDILHAGHVRYLNQSAKLGDVLFVGLNSDVSVRKLKGNGRPINPETDRAEVLAGLEAVSYIIIFDEPSPSVLLDIVKPDVYTKGGDYTAQTLPETPIVLKNGGKIEFIKLYEGRSTTKIIDKIK